MPVSQLTFTEMKDPAVTFTSDGSAWQPLPGLDDPMVCAATP